MRAHGTISMRCGGCRCEPCVEAQYRYDKERAYRRTKGPLMVPRFGAQRRLNALRAIGWTLQEVALRLGYHPQGLSAVFHGKHERMTATLFARIADVYEELSGTPGPSERARRDARRAGYAPPLAWDDIDDPDEVPVMPEKDPELVDEVVVELLTVGKPTRSTPRERREAVRVLNTVERLADSEIAERLGITQRSVFRIRQELRLPAAVGADGQAVAA